MKRILLLTLMAVAVIATGCEKEKGLSQEEMNRYLKLERTDLSGAEYLAIMETGGGTKSTPDNRDVYKIDKDGNITALVFYFTYSKDENGQLVSIEKRTDVRVVPSRIANFGGIYTFFYWCSYFDERTGETIRPEFTGLPRHYLIHNKSGLIYEAEELENIDNQNFLNTVERDLNDDVYFSFARNMSGMEKGGEIKKLEMINGEIYIKTVSPANMKFMGFALSNSTGTFIAGETIGGCYKNSSTYPATIVYPNGGFELINWIASGVSLLNFGKDFKRLDFSIRDDNNKRQTTFTIKNLVLSSTPPHSLSGAERTLVVDEYLPFYADYSIDCKNHYVIGGHVSGGSLMLLVLNKNTTDIQIVKPDKPIPSFDNRIGNTVFSINGNTITSYDFETLTLSEVTYDLSALGGFYEVSTSFKTDPPRYVKYGTRGSDGKAVTIEIDIKTGAVNVATNPDNRQTIQLVRLN